MAAEEGTSCRESPPRRRAQRTDPAGNVLHFVHLAVAVQGHVTAGADGARRAVSQRAAQSLHRKVVGQQQAIEPDMTPDDLLHASRGYGYRSFGIDRIEQEVARHAPGKVRKQPEGEEIRAFELVTRRRYARQGDMAVDRRPAMPRHVLDD